MSDDHLTEEQRRILADVQGIESAPTTPLTVATEAGRKKFEATRQRIQKESAERRRISFAKHEAAKAKRNKSWWGRLLNRYVYD